MRYILILCAASWLSLAGFGAAPKVDAESERLLRAIAADFHASKAAEVDLRLTVKIRTPPQDLSAGYALSVAKPNKFALIRKTGDLGASSLSDGTNAVTFLAEPNVYSIQPAPRDIAGIEADSNSPTGDSMGSMAFIAALFSAKPYEALMEGVVEASFGGKEGPTQRINFKQEGLSWTLFLSSGEKPVVQKIDVEIPQMLMTLEFSNWRMNAPIGGERFKFIPPTGARKVPSVYEKQREGGDSDLIGEALPPFQLKTVDGGTFDTAKLKGTVTLLVCWAGDTDHSIQTLKAAIQLAAQKKIGLTSINIEEDSDPTKIQSLLAKYKLAVKTAVDPRSEATEKLEIEGVPMTFLIDKSGSVQKAWLGYHPAFSQVLGREIDLLLGNPGR